jgi:hypothetical protein
MVVLCRSNLQERMSEWGQSLPKRDIRVTSIYPSISDMILQLSKRRKGPEATIGGAERLAPILGACKWHTMSIKDLGGPAPKYLPCSSTAAGDHRNKSMMRIPDFHEEMERFQNHIPTWVGHNLNRLRGDRAKWLRVPTGVALIGGGVLGFLPLPVVAVWMLPVGLALLAHDIPTMRRPMARLLHFTNRRIEKRKN